MQVEICIVDITVAQVTHTVTLSLCTRRGGLRAGTYVGMGRTRSACREPALAREKPLPGRVACLPFSCFLLSGAAANCHGPGFAAHSIERDADNAWTGTTIMGSGDVFVRGNQGWWDRDGVRGGRERQGVLATNRGALGRQDALVHRIQLRV